MGNRAAEREVASASGAARQKSAMVPGCQGSHNLSARATVYVPSPILNAFNSFSWSLVQTIFPCMP